MDRRSLIKAAGVLAASGLPAPAIAQSTPRLRWRLAISFPRSLDILFGMGETIAATVAEATDGAFSIQTFAPGEIVPAFAVLDAVSDATVEIGVSPAYYYFGKDPTFALFTAMPFGPTSRMQSAWYAEGGGLELLQEFAGRYGVVAWPCGNTGTQMAGWFRKEVGSVDDLAGLRFRIAGLGGTILAKVGVVPQVIAGPDVYSALEKGVIDAAEWVGPYDDEKLGFNKIAPHYYTPGWWEGGATAHVWINEKAWASLRPNYQWALRNAVAIAGARVEIQYDARNPAALKRLIAGGAKVRVLPSEVMDSCYKAAQETYTELSTTNADFKRVHDSIVNFTSDQFPWFQLTEGAYVAFVASASAASPR